ncbi:MAG: hypothetical protein GX437_12990 [Sphingobacteriales bacterium]|nr:hypothetical protein [Sphingobacteriales bacterium]
MKSKVLGILLIFSFVAPVFTTYFVLKYQQKQIKREIKWRMIAGIDKKELVLLKFTKEEKKTLLRWEHSKEFEYKGEMYDVVDSKTIGDTTYYWLWWDNEETRLNKELKKLVFFTLGNNQKNQENKNHLYKFYKSLYVTEGKNKEIILTKEEKVLFYFCQRIYQSISLSPPDPPPRLS